MEERNTGQRPLALSHNPAPSLVYNTLELPPEIASIVLQAGERHNATLCARRAEQTDRRNL